MDEDVSVHQARKVAIKIFQAEIKQLRARVRYIDGYRTFYPSWHASQSTKLRNQLKHLEACFAVTQEAFNAKLKLDEMTRRRKARKKHGAW